MCYVGILALFDIILKEEKIAQYRNVASSALLWEADSKPWFLFTRTVVADYTTLHMTIYSNPTAQLAGDILSFSQKFVVDCTEYVQSKPPIKQSERIGKGFGLP